MNPPTTLEHGKVQTPADTRPPKSRHRWWVWLLVLGVLAYAGYRVYEAQIVAQRATAKAQAARFAPRNVPVTAVPAHLGDLPVTLSGLGTVTPYQSVTVKTRIDGQLIHLLYREGQMVNKGELLAEIDPRPYEVLVAQAQGQLARDEAQLNEARTDLARYQALYDAKVIAKQQLDTQAALAGQWEGTIKADQAAIGSAQLQLAYCKIYAPNSGRIGLRLVDEGNMIHAADANGIALITQVQPIAVLFTIPEDNLPAVLQKLHAGARLTTEAFDREGTKLLATGVLETVDNQIDPTTGTSRLKAVFPNTDGSLFPNQFVNVRLQLDTQRGLTIVPAAAIQRGPDGTYVYVVQAGNKVAVRPVTTGLGEGNDVSITSGLKPGEKVVIDGADKLTNGSKVTLAGQATGSARRRPGA